MAGWSQRILCLRRNLLSLLQHDVQRANLGSAWNVVWNRGRGRSVESLERRHAYGGMEGGVVLEFCQMYEFEPLARVVTTKTTKVGLQVAVQNLSLPISLRLLSQAELEISTL